MDGQVKNSISFEKFGESSKFTSQFEFEVKRAGDDPMVEMVMCDNKSQWGLHCKSFEITNSDVKVIKEWGY